MRVNERYQDVKSGQITELLFLEEARKDGNLRKFISNRNTFDEAVTILKNKGLLYEQETPKADKIDFFKMFNEGLAAWEVEEDKTTEVNPYEFEKGWRYEFIKAGKTDDAALQKAKDKAIKNLQKDAIFYTKLELVKDSVEHQKKRTDQPLDISKGQNLVDKDNQAKPVKVKTDISSEEYLKAAEAKEEAVLNEGVTEDKLPGGQGDKLKPEDVDPKELEMGIKYELDHTKDKQIAQEIALDHLSEDPKYYTKLKTAGIDEGIFSSDPLGKLKGKEISFTTKNGDQLNSVSSKAVSSKLDKGGAWIITLAGNQTLAITKGGTKGVYFKTKDQHEKVADLGQDLKAAADKVFKESQIKEQIKAVLREKLLKEYVGSLPTEEGPDVDRKNLEHELKNYDWYWQNNDDEYLKKQAQLRDDKVRKLVDKLGEEGVKLYNEYAPKDLQWGAEVKEDEAKPEIHQQLKDMEDMDPKDLADQVLANKFGPHSVKTKAAAQLLAHAMKTDKDSKIQQAFLKLAKKPVVNEASTPVNYKIIDTDWLEDIYGDYLKLSNGQLDKNKVLSNYKDYLVKFGNHTNLKQPSAQDLLKYVQDNVESVKKKYDEVYKEPRNFSKN